MSRHPKRSTETCKGTDWCRDNMNDPLKGCRTLSRCRDMRSMSRQWKRSQQERRSRDLNSKLGQATLKPTAGYIGIRAQLRNPINGKLPREKKVGCRRIRSRDLGSLRLHFLFLFFFFLFFSLFFSFRRFLE